MSFVKKGIRPQRSETTSRSPASRLLRMIGWMVVGATCSPTAATGFRRRPDEHDGRTSNLVEAIEDHRSPGSEANKVIESFNQLSAQ